MCVVPHGVPGMNVNALMPTGMTMLEPLSGQHRMTGIAVQVTVAPPTPALPLAADLTKQGGSGPPHQADGLGYSR